MSEYFIFDTETSPQKLIEFGWVYLVDLEIVNQGETLIHNNDFLHPEITISLGITNAMLKVAPTFKRAIAPVLHTYKNCLWVGQNIRFDLGMLSRAAQEAGDMTTLSLIQNAKTLDTIKLFKNRFPKEKSASLDNILRVLKVPTDTPRHRALSDALYTTYALVRLLAY